MERESYEIRWKDYYQVLGLEPGANLREIRQAWRRLSKNYHPDVAGHSKANVARIAKLDAAYEVLSDRDRRAKYDEAYQARGTKSPKASPAKGATRRRPPTSPPPAVAAAPAPTVAASAAPAPWVAVAAAPAPRAPVAAAPAPTVAASAAPAPWVAVAAAPAPQAALAPASPPWVAVAAAPAPHAAPPSGGIPPHNDEPPVPSAPGSGPKRRNGLLAAAGVIGIAVLIAIGVGPALMRESEPAAPVPVNLSLLTPTPLPATEPAPTPSPAELPTQPEPAPVPTVMLPPEPTAAPDPAPTPAPGEPISVLSPEAEALGYRGFHLQGRPWMVHFTSECQEAPCLRSAALTGTGFSTLSLDYSDELPGSVLTISFDVKTTGAGCCASFRVVGGARQVSADLAGDGSWTRVEVVVGETRPVSFQWQFWSAPAGATAADGVWVDNIQFH